MIMRCIMAVLRYAFYDYNFGFGIPKTERYRHVFLNLIKCFDSTKAKYASMGSSPSWLQGGTRMQQDKSQREKLEHIGNLESKFDATFATTLALKEKQIQQSYRPIIGVHKWFARRPGTIFRSLMLAEYSKDEAVKDAFWHGHNFKGVIADPFMGGGTPVYEATRLGFHVAATDINPMAYWVVRQSLADLDIKEFKSTSQAIIADVEKEIAHLYKTTCECCSQEADVKYFLWVKVAECPGCKTKNDLFPGYLLAEDERHPKNVLVCGECGELNEFGERPTASNPEECKSCHAKIVTDGPAKKGEITCRKCDLRFKYNGKGSVRSSHPEHRLWAIEYHCHSCKKRHKGRFFKRPDKADLKKVDEANLALVSARELPIPDDHIPPGDETDRLIKWGYRFYRDMFNNRQLLGLGFLLKRILDVNEPSIRHALLTVFSDSLRYQNMLCRYDTYALKCQDIFSVHGFPVGLVQCENNLLGIPKVGSGSFCHFVEKYIRAKEYCLKPFETRQIGGKKVVEQIVGETIVSKVVESFPKGRNREANLLCAPAWEISLPKNSLDGVFTDPPYFDNVQYAELMDFCFVWLRLALKSEFEEFRARSTRAENELTGNDTLGRDLAHFTEGLSRVFVHYSEALKPKAPFVFTYHHNAPLAYLPLVVAILDAGLNCTATLPAAAEMSASLHIAGTGSSILDSVFVCRQQAYCAASMKNKSNKASFDKALSTDYKNMTAAGLKITRGDLLCLSAGHVARFSINALAKDWDSNEPLNLKMRLAKEVLERTSKEVAFETKVAQLMTKSSPHQPHGRASDATL